MKLFFTVLVLIAGAIFAQAGELLAARILFKPESPYVGQPFEIRLEIEVTPGVELQDLQLQGLPLDTLAKLSTYQAEARRQIQRGNATVDILAFVANGRALQPARQVFRGALHTRLVERYSMGFFSSLRTVSASLGLEPLQVTFRPLPTTSVPPGFQGAVGNFTLTGIINPTQAMPGDIVTILYSVTGHGWLGDTQVYLPPPNPNFRVYPPQETQRDESGTLELRQVVVPLNTNAMQIGVARFPYFDPDAGAYREAFAGPFNLNLSLTFATNSDPAVRHINVAHNTTTPSESNNAAMAATISHAQRLLPFTAVFLLAIMAAGWVYQWRPRLAIVAGIILFIAGSYLCQQWKDRAQANGRAVRELAAARLCPSANARILFHITPDRQVTPLEVSDEWIRVDSDGQRGWIQSRVLSP